MVTLVLAIAERQQRSHEQRACRALAIKLMCAFANAENLPSFYCATRVDRATRPPHVDTLGHIACAESEASSSLFD